MDVKPDKHEAWNNWGTHLANLTQLTIQEDREKSKELFVKAEANVKHALTIKGSPKYHGLLGHILLATGRYEEGVEEKAHAALQFALERNVVYVMYELGQVWSHHTDLKSTTALKCGVALALHLKMFKSSIEEWPV